MSGTSRFDCYPSDFLNGVVGLTGDEIAAYTIVMMLQYDRGEPVAYVGREREISVRSGLPRGRLSKAVEKLLELGKLTLEAGCLLNGRTSQELEKISERIRKNVENSQIGGAANKDKWETIRNKNNEKESLPDSLPDSRNIALLPSSLPPSPKEEELSLRERRAQQVSSSSRKKPRTQIVEDAQPTPKDTEVAKSYDLSDSLFRTEWKKFRAHHVACGSLMANWGAAWEKWCGNIAGYQPRAGPTNGHSASPLPPERDVHAAAQRLHDRITDGTVVIGDAPKPHALVFAEQRERERQDIVRLLPQRGSG